jgi:catechol 2,3-dioxygenase-like lactoylglutathione lyase family enzyme
MIKGLEHVGISVANLERSMKFYRDLLGMEVVVAVEPFKSESYGGNYGKILGLTGASGRVAVVRKGNMQFELFEFQSPAPKRGDPQRPVCNHGITHFCIEVSNIEDVYGKLAAAGVPFHCPPLDFGTAKATYGRDPDGNVFELLEMCAPKP